jgi:hypothetical protein
MANSGEVVIQVRLAATLFSPTTRDLRFLTGRKQLL